MIFVDKVRFFQKESANLEESIRKAIKYCEKHDILKEYLEIHGSEVLNMLLEEWNTEDAIAYARKESREEARLEDKQRFLELFNQGFSAEEIGKQLYSDFNAPLKLYNRE
ncbi:MAG: hypothetical protein LBV20_01930 [Treponema sp.]|jgi:HD-like signal output (HDOD) protein|nr:hypothetical protein [Treponema sp.]